MLHVFLLYVWYNFFKRFLPDLLGICWHVSTWWRDGLRWTGCLRSRWNTSGCHIFRVNQIWCPETSVRCPGRYWEPSLLFYFSIKFSLLKFYCIYLWGIFRAGVWVRVWVGVVVVAGVGFGRVWVEYICVHMQNNLNLNLFSHLKSSFPTLRQVWVARWLRGWWWDSLPGTATSA